MVGSFIRLAAAAALSCSLAACSALPKDEFTDSPRDRAQVAANAPVQCVPYARTHSGIDIHGDAYTWWDKAAGRFERGSAPKNGAVLVLNEYGGPKRGHLAVVRAIVSAREIRVDHANWFADGAIYVDDPVMDVSADNDWSRVRVWNIRTGAWGIRDYSVQGFIGPGRTADTGRVAQLNLSEDR
jgi:surface antigen